MQKLKRLLLIILAVSLLVLVGSTLFFILRPKVAGVYIDATPSATVFLNGKVVGSTPYKVTQDPQEVVIKLVPKDTTQMNLIPYETRVSLLPGVETVVRHTFGTSQDTGSGEIVSFESIAKEETSLSIVTIPDGAEITIDGATKVFAPHKSSTVDPGDHILLVSAKGYTDRQVKVKTNKGYKLTAVITLSKSSNGMVIPPTPTVSITVPKTSNASVQILTTVTGTLRVRKEADATSEEVGIVTSGVKYPFLDHNEQTGWLKIKFDGKEGWVSGQYAIKVEDTVTRTPTRSATVTTAPSPILTPTPTAAPSIPG